MLDVQAAEMVQRAEGLWSPQCRTCSCFCTYPSRLSASTRIIIVASQSAWANASVPHLQLFLHVPLQAGHIYEGSQALLGSLLGLPLLLHVGSCLLQLQDLQLRLQQEQQVDQGCALRLQSSGGDLPSCSRPSQLSRGTSANMRVFRSSG